MKKFNKRHARNRQIIIKQKIIIIDGGQKLGGH